jgi:hypothetical protein
MVPFRYSTGSGCSRSSRSTAGVTWSAGEAAASSAYRPAPPVGARTSLLTGATEERFEILKWSDGERSASRRVGARAPSAPTRRFPAYISQSYESDQRLSPTSGRISRADGEDSRR